MSKKKLYLLNKILATLTIKIIVLKDYVASINGINE